MNKLRMMSKDILNDNIEKIDALFPNCITETKEGDTINKAIDFDLLKQELADCVVEGPAERYHLDWPGKKESLLAANMPIDKTLRPDRNDSVNFDQTKNLYIEGDNLDALKLLQETYLGKIKMIYIDPPYNTGKDFIYKDRFVSDSDKWSVDSGQKDEEGNKLVDQEDFKQNLASNGRYHSDWLSMMYPRLKLARNLLKEDGVIFISIDDNEVHNLRKICDEVFGAGNFVGEIIRKTKSMTGDNGNGLNLQHENLILYAKNKTKFWMKGSEKKFENYSNYDGDPLGDWCIGDPSAKSGGESTYFSIINPFTNKVDYPPKGRYWAFSKSSLEKYIKEGKIKFKHHHSDNERGFIFKRYKNKLTNLCDPVNSLFPVENEYMNQSGTTELKNLFQEIMFSYPKPVLFLYKIIKSCTNFSDIILDFFSGSATTAHAVMKLNAEDNGNRRFIMVQLPEKCDEKSEAFKAGYSTIAEIGKERIRRAGKKILEESDEPLDNLDIGFRVLKIGSSNMAPIYYRPDEITQDSLFETADNIKPDRTEEDLLFQVLLDWGVDLSLPIEKKLVCDRPVYFVDTNALAACFVSEGSIDEEFVRALAEFKPLRVVFRDAGYKGDDIKINVEQIFKQFSPHTDVKCL